MHELNPVARLPNVQGTAPHAGERVVAPDGSKTFGVKVDPRPEEKSPPPVSSDGHAGKRHEPGRMLDVVG